MQKIDESLAADVLLAEKDAEFSAGKYQGIGGAFFADFREICPMIDSPFPEHAVLFQKCISVENAVIAPEQHQIGTGKAKEEKQNTAEKSVPVGHAVSPDDHAENPGGCKNDKPDDTCNSKRFGDSHAVLAGILLAFFFHTAVCPPVDMTGKEFGQQGRNCMEKYRNHHASPSFSR